MQEVNETPDDTAQKLAQVVGMLTCGDLDEHEVGRIVGLCLQARQAPEQTLEDNYGADAVQVARYDPKGVTAFVLYAELEDYFAVSDTVDELHEQVVEAFETPELPDYPYDDNDFETVSDYFQWLDEQLLAHHPRYRLVHFGQSYTHDFQTILVLREQAEELLALCQELGLEADYCE